MFGRQHSGHLFHVLRGLVFHDVHGVVEGYDADQPVLRVHDRQSEEVVLAEHLGDLLFIVERADGDDVLLHDGLDGRIVVLAQKQVLDACEADELVAARHVAGVDRLLVDARAADAQNRFLDRHIRAQGDIFGGHDRAGGILRVAQDLVDLLAHIRLGLGQDALHDVRGHFLHDIDGVVDVKLVDDLLQLGIREALNQKLLRLRLHFDERFGGQLLRQKPEQKRQARLIEIVKNGGDVGGIHGAEDVAQRMILLLVEQHGQGLLQGKIAFCHVLFLLNVKNRKVKTQRRHINRRMTGAASTGRTKAAGARADFGLRMCRYYFLRPFVLPPFCFRISGAFEIAQLI